MYLDLMTPQEDTLIEAQNTSREEEKKEAERQKARDFLPSVMAAVAAGAAVGPQTRLVNQWPANCRIPGRKRSILDKTRQERKRQRQARKRRRGK